MAERCQSLEKGPCLKTIQRRECIGLLASPLAACKNQSRVPWRGFNLQEKFTHAPEEWANVEPEWGRRNEPFRESDFEQIAELGFNFVRLPMSYRCWSTPSDPYRLHEKTLLQIDQAVRWAREYELHVCLNFHRAPGFCINQALLPEPWNLWTDSKALDIFTYHWRAFAERYRHVPGTAVSFNLINEPNRCTPEQYVRVIRTAVAAIREVDSDRHIMIDGLFGEATLPLLELSDVSHATHSARGYAPFGLTHYLAPWAQTPKQLPTWPFPGAATWDQQQLQRWLIDPWLPMRAKGAAVFVGEWGCWNRTPHDVTLAWMRDLLDLWNKVNWGWALWCFRGSFGILDSNRADVKYEAWRGHKLDRRMLELFREFM